MKSVYVETSIVSYLTALPSCDLRTSAWQQITAEWWDQERGKFELFTSRPVLAEAGAGDPIAAKRRLDSLRDIPELPVDDEAKELARRLMSGGGVPENAEAEPCTSRRQASTAWTIF